MSFSSMFGSHFVPGRRWAPQIEISQENVGQVPPGDFQVDPYLPSVGVDPFDPAAAIVIPSGRFVGIGFSNGRNSGTNYRLVLGDQGSTPITLHDGKNITPAGMSINQMYRAGGEFMTDSNTVKFRKGFVAEVPFVLSINNAHGTLKSGDNLTGYWGSTTSTSNISMLHRGKPVKWTAKSLNSQTQTASATIALTAAVYPGLTPRIVYIADAGGVPLAATQAVAWNSGLALWVLSLTGTGSGSCTQVVYEMGQDSDQIAGQAMRIQGLSEVIDRDQFMRWVEYAPQDYLNFPPAAQRFPVTAVSAETPSTITANSSYRVANYPMSVHHAVLVEISNATVLDKDGNSSSYSAGTWYALPTSTMLDARSYFIGLYHAVNWRTGVITISSNIAPITGSAISIRVTYSYVTDPRDGAALWGGGIIGLTDGRNITGGQTSADGFDGTAQRITPATATGNFGVPAQLNLADVVGCMRLMVN